MASLKASERGKKLIEDAIRIKGQEYAKNGKKEPWNKTDIRWSIQASITKDQEFKKKEDKEFEKNEERNKLLNMTNTEFKRAGGQERNDLLTADFSTSSWEKFYKGKENIREDTFKIYCQVLGLDWQEITIEEISESKEVCIEDPEEYIGTVWTFVKPEKRNIGKKHLISIFWGMWKREEEVENLEENGVILTYEKNYKDKYHRIVRLSFCDEENKENFFTSDTEILNGHCKGEKLHQYKELLTKKPKQIPINIGWKEVSN